MNRESVRWQYVLHRVGPLHHDDYVRIIDHLSQLIGDNARFGQTVKVKVMDCKWSGVVYLTNSKCWTGNLVAATGAAYQPPTKGCLTAAQVTD